MTKSLATEFHNLICQNRNLFTNFRFLLERQTLVRAVLLPEEEPVVPSNRNWTRKVGWWAEAVVVLRTAPRAPSPRKIRSCKQLVFNTLPTSEMKKIKKVYKMCSKWIYAFNFCLSLNYFFFHFIWKQMIVLWISIDYLALSYDVFILSLPSCGIYLLK